MRCILLFAIRKEHAKMSTLNSRLLQYYSAKQNPSTSSAKDALDNMKNTTRDHAKILIRCKACERVKNTYIHVDHLH